MQLNKLVKTIFSSTFPTCVATLVKDKEGPRFLKRLISNVSLNHTSKTLQITFKGEEMCHDFPYIWLQDNCQCSQCFEHSAKQRLVPAKELNPDIQPQSVEVDKYLVITWPNNHISKYDKNWLKQRCFKSTETSSQSYENIKKWGSDLQGNIPTVDYNELMNNDHALLSWIVNLEKIGIHLLTGAPITTGIIDKIGKRVGFLKKTHYGETFTVKSKIHPNNVAYTGKTLTLHADLCFYHYTPGMQMLHCISQVESGGDNQFTDGFHVADVMKTSYPDMYKVLTNKPIWFNDEGKDLYGEFNKSNLVPVIQEDKDGTVIKINYSNATRDSHMSGTAEQVISFYKAMIMFESLLNHKKHLITYKLRKGEIVCFHNYRVLHGRLGYKMTSAENRHLEGGYMDWDELTSKRRVLQDKLGN